MSEPAPSQAAAVDPPEDLTARFASMLASGERVLLVRQRHWFTFIQAARWFLLVIGVGLVSAYLDGKIDDGGTFGFLGTVLGWGFGVFLVAGLIGVGWYYLAWRRERYIVTTRRFIEAGGVINKWSRDTSLSMVTDMLVGHPLMGRILGYGEIDLLTAAEAGTNKIRFLPQPDEFKKSLLDAKYEHEMEVGGGYAGQTRPVAPAPAAPAALSGAELDASLTHLADLRDRGLITAEEFEQKKRDLLDRL
jgi:hypothetical protein